jgi:hypothetical protein
MERRKLQTRAGPDPSNEQVSAKGRYPKHRSNKQSLDLRVRGFQLFPSTSDAILDLMRLQCLAPDWLHGLKVGLRYRRESGSRGIAIEVAAEGS